MNTNDYRLTAPPVLRDFLVYHETIQGHSRKTVDEYYLDLRNFFRYVKIEKAKHHVPPSWMKFRLTTWIWTWPGLSR